eukprot:1140381-Pelagomonas_calceolata.AAC.4
MAGTIHKEYTIRPLVHLGLSKQKAKSLAFKLSCHSMQRLTTITTIINSRHALCFQGASGEGGVAGCAEVNTKRRRVWASRGMADNLPDPH